MRFTQQFSKSALGVRSIRPSALIGVHISSYILFTTGYRSALTGINALLTLLRSPDEQKSASFALLEELGSMLQIVVPDMLNRSANRAEAFETYVRNLASVQARSQLHVTDAEQRLDEARDLLRNARRKNAGLERELREALRDQDYTTASIKQQQIITSEGEVAELNAKEDELRSIIKLFEELLDVADERLTAMRANREALIAGLSVIDVPGVEDLGLIKDEKSDRGQGGLFGPIF